VDQLFGVPVARPSSFLSFATSLAIAGLVFVAAWTRLARARDFLLVAMLGALAISRTVVLLGLASFLLVTVARQFRRGSGLVIVAGLTVVAYLVSQALSGDSSFGDEVVSRGANSTAARTAVYEATLIYWERFNSRYPWGGLGNPVSLMGVPYPLGSHSMYLGTLFRFGILGLLGMMFLCLGVLAPVARASLAGLAWVASLFVVFIVEDVTLDPINWVGIFLVVGLIQRTQDGVDNLSYQVGKEVA
jgi:hypothetical protein